MTSILEKSTVNMPTNLPKRLLAALVFAPLYTSAQVDMDFWDRKSWVQIGEKSSLYLGGWTDISFQDGSYELAGCAFHPSFSIVGPNIFCPLGTNGFSAKGDIDPSKMDPDTWQEIVQTATRSEIIDKLLLKAARSENMQIDPKKLEMYSFWEFWFRMIWYFKRTLLHLQK